MKRRVLKTISVMALGLGLATLGMIENGMLGIATIKSDCTESTGYYECISNNTSDFIIDTEDGDKIGDKFIYFKNKPCFVSAKKVFKIA